MGCDDKLIHGCMRGGRPASTSMTMPDSNSLSCGSLPCGTTRANRCSACAAQRRQTSTDTLRQAGKASRILSGSASEPAAACLQDARVEAGNGQRLLHVGVEQRKQLLQLRARAPPHARHITRTSHAPRHMRITPSSARAPSAAAAPCVAQQRGRMRPARSSVVLRPSMHHGRQRRGSSNLLLPGLTQRAICQGPGTCSTELGTHGAAQLSRCRLQHEGGAPGQAGRLAHRIDNYLRDRRSRRDEERAVVEHRAEVVEDLRQVGHVVRCARRSARALCIMFSITHHVRSISRATQS